MFCIASNCIFRISAALMLVPFFYSFSNAQVKAVPDTAKMAYNALSKEFNLAAFPAKNQSQKQQKKDEFDCYMWAAQESGIDPMNFPVAKADSVQTGPDGTVVRSSARGALAGLALGAIAGDAGKGAAIGAAAGGMRGVGRAGARQQQRQQQAEAKAQQKNQENAAKYLRAFVACMEGKGYSVK